MRLEEILQCRPVWRGASLEQGLPGAPTGFDALDAALPGHGWPAGELTELLADARGIGELQLVLPVLRALTSAGKRIVWLAPPHMPYAPALFSAGLDLTQLAVVQPRRRSEALWAAEQVLRTGACHALLAWLPRLRYADLQRLALGAEQGRGLAFLFRPAATAREPSPAALRLALQSYAGELVVRILKRRGAPTERALRLSLGLPMGLSRHALGCIAFSPDSLRDDRADRRLGLPVHA